MPANRRDVIAAVANALDGRAAVLTSGSGSDDALPRT